MLEAMRRRRFWIAFPLILALLFNGSCADKQQAVGAIDDQSSRVLMRSEVQEDGIEGIVYRHIINFQKLLAESPVPVLVVLYGERDPLPRLIPYLEDLADQERDRLQVCWIDAQAEPEIVETVQAKVTPSFIIIRRGVIERSMSGFGSAGEEDLRSFLMPVLGDPEMRTASGPA